MLKFAKKIEETYPLAFSLVGPFFLIASLALTLFIHHPNHDLWWIVLLGMAFAWKFEWKGAYSALIALLFSILFKHAEMQSQHVWQLGLESSVALGLWITAESQEKIKAFLSTLKEEGKKSLCKADALEAEILRKGDQFESEKNVMQERLDQIKKEIETSEKDKSSLKELIRTMKENDAEKERLKEEYILEMARKTIQVQSLELSLAEAKEETQLLGDGRRLQDNNKDLRNQLNVVRLDKYQSRLINEALAKTLTREMKKKEIESIESIQLLEKERENLKAKITELEANLAYEAKTLLGEKKALENRIVELEETSSQKTTKQTEFFEKEKRVLKERITELESAQKKEEASIEQSKLLEKERDNLKEKVEELSKDSGSEGEIEVLKKERDTLRERIKELKSLSKKNETAVLKPNDYRKLEAEFRQLKKQFDERKNILHQTRSELFRMEGALLVSELDKEQKSLEPSLEEEKWYFELQTLEEEREGLEKENEQLQEIIQILSEKLQGSKESSKKDLGKRPLTPYGGDPHLIQDLELGFHKKSR